MHVVVKLWKRGQHHQTTNQPYDPSTTRHHWGTARPRHSIEVFLEAFCRCDRLARIADMVARDWYESRMWKSRRLMEVSLIITIPLFGRWDWGNSAFRGVSLTRSTHPMSFLIALIISVELILFSDFLYGLMLLLIITDSQDHYVRIIYMYRYCIQE